MTLSSLFYYSVFGPRLYQTYSSSSIPGKVYVPNTAEWFGDSVIKWIKIGWSLSCWTSPILLTFLYRKGMFCVGGMQVISSYFGGVGVILVCAIFVRAFGRCLNKDYAHFIHILSAAQKSFTTENKRRLAQYDFDISARPVDFKSNDVDRYNNDKPRVTTVWRPKNLSLTSRLKALPFEFLAYFSVHTFGRRMLYPGATGLIQTLMASALMQGRAKLYEQYAGNRAKLRTRDGNDIDTMFVDRRKPNHEGNGEKLVICCEGNAGFYEVGCMCTPLEVGYSVLGWNHPGFAESTGVPFPSQEQNAIDVVINYAIHELKFPEDRIVLFGWSIGGYSVTWAASNYPDLSHVVLDATFDDVLPLAYAKLPSSWAGVIEMGVRKYLNLNNAEQLCRYPGPILLIRRSKDEMITSVDPTVLSSNRGNDLVLKLIEHRYPHVVDDDTKKYMQRWLSVDKHGQEMMKQQFGVSDKAYEDALTRAGVDESYPLQLGQTLAPDEKIKIALFLLSKYMEDFDSTHCTPLPPSYFREPWIDPASIRGQSRR